MVDKNSQEGGRRDHQPLNPAGCGMVSTIQQIQKEVQYSQGPSLS